MYSYVLYYNIEQSGFNAVSASLVIPYLLCLNLCLWHCMGFDLELERIISCPCDPSG